MKPNQQKVRGRITNIQRMSIHDGPGIRTTIFLKGCNMRCKWCHNPETWEIKNQIEYIKDNCIQCWNCIASCPENAIQPTKENYIQINRERCTACGECQETCYSGALIKIGDDITVNELMNKIMLDITHYNVSGGGVTISGGEPLLQVDFVKELLIACKEEDIHTCVESNLASGWEKIEEILPYVDLWRCDLKLAEAEKHKKWTGISNKKIIENLSNLSKFHIPVVISTPVVPGVNDNEEEIKNICEHLKKWNNIEAYDLLPFHQMGYSKFESIGMKNPMPESATLDDKVIEKLKLITAQYGF